MCNVTMSDLLAVYYFLLYFGSGKLYNAKNLTDVYYKDYLCFLKDVRKNLNSQVLEYIIDENKSVVTIKEQDTDNILASMPVSDFSDNAKILFNGIKSASGRSVPAPDAVCEFAQIIYVSKPKAPAVQALKKQFGGKNDIFIEVRDGQTSIVSVMGFSIKSKFGQNPTLFNAGSSSQFLYKLTNCDDNAMDEFNNITDETGNRGWAKCKEYLYSHGITLEFTGTKNPIYSNNLFLIRESMSKIMAWCVKDRLIDADSDYEVMETTARMIAANPLGVPNPDVYYEKAIKDFLMAGFTGMTAGSRWDGKEQVNGGYIVVMDDGDSQIPTTKMLAEIAMKNCLRTIGKRELEAQIYNALEISFNLPQQISNGHQDIIKLDLREEELSFKKAKRSYNKPFDNDYYIGIYIELPYKVPIAYQGEVALWCDLEGNKINDLFNKSNKYWIKNINVAVFPLKDKSIVLVFVEKDNKRYGNFFKQVKKLPLDKQLQVINYIIFACTEDYFLSPYLSTDTMELLEDVAGMTSEMINLSGEYNEYESAETAISYYSFDKMNEIPNILSNEYQIKNIAE